MPEVKARLGKRPASAATSRQHPARRPTSSSDFFAEIRRRAPDAKIRERRGARGCHLRPPDAPQCRAEVVREDQDGRDNLSTCARCLGSYSEPEPAVKTRGNGVGTGRVGALRAPFTGGHTAGLVLRTCASCAISRPVDAQTLWVPGAFENHRRGYFCSIS